MPSSAVQTFTDPDDYSAAIRATRAELTVTGRGHFAAKITRIDLHRLWMQRFSDNLPRVAHSAAMTGPGPLAGAPCRCRKRKWFPSGRRLPELTLRHRVMR